MSPSYASKRCLPNVGPPRQKTPRPVRCSVLKLGRIPLPIRRHAVSLPLFFRGGRCQRNFTARTNRLGSRRKSVPKVAGQAAAIPGGPPRLCCSRCLCEKHNSAAPTTRLCLLCVLVQFFRWGGVATQWHASGDPSSAFSISVTAFGLQIWGRRLVHVPWQKEYTFTLSHNMLKNPV